MTRQSSIMSSDDFYKALPAKPIQSGLFDSAHYYPVPDDWMIVIADVIGSTAAVAQGRYKNVNVLSSCAIIAVLNRVGRDRVAYIYGGDGATFLVPPSLAFDTASALFGAKKTGQEVYDLDLRVGMVRIGDLRAAGHEVRIAKLETAGGLFQTAISGGGVVIAERWIKDPAQPGHQIERLFDPAKLGAVPPSYDGFECRWKPLTSRNGVSVSLLLASRLRDERRSIELYEAVIEKIVEVCGSEDLWRPVSAAQLNISPDPRDYRQEVLARTSGRSQFGKVLYWLKTSIMTWAGKLCVRVGWKMGSFDGKTYIAETVAHSDYLKFENALKLVMDISLEQSELLEAYFERLQEQRIIFFGMHKAPAAMMTCLVFSHDKDHFHFIDGADGGYTMAAQTMKAQMRMAEREQLV